MLDRACLHVLGHGTPHQAIGQGLESTPHIVAAGADHHDVQVAGGQIQACRRHVRYSLRAWHL